MDDNIPALLINISIEVKDYLINNTNCYIDYLDDKSNGYDLRIDDFAKDMVAV